MGSVDGLDSGPGVGSAVQRLAILLAGPPSAQVQVLVVAHHNSPTWYNSEPRRALVTHLLVDHDSNPAKPAAAIACYTARLLREHFLQDTQRFRQGGGTDRPETANQPCPIYSPELVEDDVAVLLQEPARDAEGVGVAPRRHWSDEKRTEVLVQLIRRDDDAGSCLTDLATLGWIERNEVDVTSLRCRHSHVHSDSSNAVGVGSSKRPSSPRARSFAAATPHS